MTNPSIGRIHHYNNLSWGACYYFDSVSTTRRLIFRANEIASVRPAPFGTAFVTTVEGCEFRVTSTKPSTVS
jgi:hypothetical protein